MRINIGDILIIIGFFMFAIPLINLISGFTIGVLFLPYHWFFGLCMPIGLVLLLLIGLPLSNEIDDKKISGLEEIK